jgi:Ca2+-binding RTX toxin-like protein
MENGLIAARRAGADPALVNMCSAGITASSLTSGVTLVTGGGNPNDIYNPIGAFYESRSAGNDPALSIASKTFRILNTTGQGVTAAQLTALDTNRDGKLSGAELNGLTAWSDLSEDGVLTTNELTTLAAALTTAGLSSLSAKDYATFTAGNAFYKTAAQAGSIAPILGTAAPLAAASNFATLRATDNRYILWANQYGASWIDWQPGHIKINQGTPNSLIGTNGNDSMDADHYAAYLGGLAGYFNINALTNFYAGGGDDVFGGSSRNDNVWGGTGNDTLFGYAGDDKLYGEEGNDQIQGGYGNDTLDGGIGNDRLFGEVGNDTLVGGDGDDIMLGFTASNDAKQTLLAGETDNDLMYGGNGNDQMYGGLGNDVMSGDAGNDLVDGGAGDDTLYGGAGLDELNGGTGNDTLDGGADNDKLFGGVGNDTLYGGDGDDILVGFTPTNDAKQTLAAGETDNDIIYGGAGNDLVIAGLGDDQAWGGTGNDEIQGGAGNDQLYGEDGNDRLFGGAGDDTIYGGAGDDLIFGGVASNEAALAAGVSDNNFLYGGAGNDTIVGGVGNDYIDGGAGADYMQGGKGDDTYIVNSVNDVILELQNEGYDTVIASNNYILNTGIEELRLTEGGQFNGTGNSLANKIIGNSQDNILDGVTGADTMIGGLGNDTYYVDNVGDVVTEVSGEGVDTVDSSISYTLGANVENLTLLDFSKAEKGIADGTGILVYGYPKAFELDYMQGDAVAGYKGTCALTAIANLGTQANQQLSESQVVTRAITNGWAVTSSTATDYQRGGSNYIGQQALLNSYGIRNGIVMGYNEQGLANLIKGGRGVIVAVNAGKLWGDSAYVEGGGVNHVVTLTGVACDAATGAINGFYIADSGRGKVSDMTRYISIADFRADVNVTNAYAIYTIDPIKLWEENVNGTGNELDNVITGNRGNNILTGNKGNDTLIGQAGNDTYQFNKGDGMDTLIDSDATAGNLDVLQLGAGVNQNNLWLKHVGNNLQISIMGSTDQIIVKDWYLTGASGADNQIERIKTADGRTMWNTDVEKLVQAMAAFAPPAAATTSWTSGATQNGQTLLAVTH